MEAEAKAKAEQEAKQNTQQSSPVAMAQWENATFGDVHDRVNYLNTHHEHLDVSVNWSDSETLQYLQTLRDDLKTSGEMQLQAHLEGDF